MEWIAVIFALGFGVLAGWRISAKKTAALAIRNAALEQENRLVRETCDRDIAAGPGTALVPMTKDGAPLTRKMFAFWLESNDSSLQWEFSEALARHFM